MHGKDITIPKGTEITAYTNGNIPLDRSSFDDHSNSNEIANADSSIIVTQVDIVSTPTGADIEIDGAFVGNAPSSVTLKAGEHIFKVTKKGFKEWQKIIVITSGKINITAELEPIQ